MKPLKQLWVPLGHLLVHPDHLLFKIGRLLFPTIIDEHLEINLLLLFFFDSSQDNIFSHVAVTGRVLENFLHHFVEVFYNTDLVEFVDIKICGHLTVFNVLHCVIDLNEHFFDFGKSIVGYVSKRR